MADSPTSHPAGFPASSGGGGGGAPGAKVPFATSGAISANSAPMGNKGAEQITIYWLDIPYDITFDTIELNVTGSDDGVHKSSFAIISPVTGAVLASFGPATGINTNGAELVDFTINEGTVTLTAGRYGFATVNENGTGFTIELFLPTVVNEFYCTNSVGVGGAFVPPIVVVSGLKASLVGSNDAPANPHPGNTQSPILRLFHS